MKSNPSGEELVALLLDDPPAFYNAGTGIKLLQSYFDGFTLETLRPLLSNSDRIVKRVAIWVTSELGSRGRPLIKEAIALLCDDDRYIKYHAFEVVAVCSVADDASDYRNVVRGLEDGDEVIRQHVMFLVSNANVSQLKAAAEFFRSNSSSDQLHAKGLSQLVSEHVDGDAIAVLIHASEPLLRKYGAIAAWRRRVELPDLLSSLADSADPDVAAFWKKRAPKEK